MYDFSDATSSEEIVEEFIALFPLSSLPFRESHEDDVHQLEVQAEIRSDNPRNVFEAEISCVIHHRGR